MQGQALSDYIAADVHKDIDMHADYMSSVAQGDMFEIGVRTGISTAAFLRGLEKNGGHLYSADIESQCGNIFAGHPQWTFVNHNSRDVAIVKSKIPAKLDVLFIDGDHTYEGVKSDLESYGLLVKDGGIIVMHDVVSGYDPGVRKAADEYATANNYAFDIIVSWVGLGVMHVKRG